MKALDHFLFTEKYRPKTIDECVLTPSIKKKFKDLVAAKDFQHLLLSGSAGVGKTTVARALANELNMEVLFLNASEEGGIDTLRNRIRDFCLSVSLEGRRKCVILDEADNATTAFYAAFRSFLEEFSKNVRFILTCNYMNRIDYPIHSRCAVIDFTISKEEKFPIMKEFLARVIYIIKQEKIQVPDTKVLMPLITKHFPDFRRVLNEIQQYGASGVIDAAAVEGNQLSNNVKVLMTFIKDKKFTEVRKWCAQNCQGKNLDFFRAFYNLSTEHCQTNSIPQLVLLIAQYQYKAAFVADGEINFLAFCVECMTDIEFK